jgi:predicted nucleic acid-binding protein
MINIGEAIYLTSRRNGPLAASVVLGEIDRLPVSQLPTTRERIIAAAHIRARHRLSYADAFVAGAGLELAATILTGDPEFRSIEDEVDIEWLNS